MQKYPNVVRIRNEIKKSSPEELVARIANGEVQQYLLYAASNDALFNGVLDDDRDKMAKSVTLASAQELVDKVQHSAYAAAHWPHFAAGARTTVDNDTTALEQTFMYMIEHGTKKYGGAYTDVEAIENGYGGGKIHLADNGFAMQRVVVLHELGHAIESFEGRRVSQGSGHDANFARTNIELIREFESPEKADALEKAFKFAGVEVASASQSQPHRSIR